MAAKSKPAIVVDTNLFVSAIIHGGTPSKLISAWKNDKFILITSRSLLEELVDVLDRAEIRKYKPSKEEIEQLLDGLELNAVFVTPILISELPIYSRDPNDNKFLACCFGSKKVDYLITGDKDLLALKGRRGLGVLKIVTVGEFLSFL